MFSATDVATFLACHHVRLPPLRISIPETIPDVLAAFAYLHRQSGSLLELGDTERC
jgi:hypothetical protein